MPGFDGTGPRGTGSFSGGGRGHCAIVLPPAGSAQAPYGYVGRAGTPAILEDGMGLPWDEPGGQPGEARWMCMQGRRRGAQGGRNMPGRDGTGPRGEGPLTGWGDGNCAAGSAGGGAFAPRWGRRMGRRPRRNLWGLRGGRWFDAAVEPATADQEIGYLERESGWLQAQLGAVQERLAALKGGRGDDSE